MKLRPLLISLVFTALIGVMFQATFQTHVHAQVVAQEQTIPEFPPPEAAANAPLLLQTDTSAELDLTVFPPVAYLGVIPGRTITHKVVLRYNGVGPVTVTPELRDFKTDGLTGTPILDSKNSTPFISIQNQNRSLGKPFLMQPNTTTELIIKISPEATVTQREYPLSLVLIAHPSAPNQLQASSAQTAAGVASNIILSIAEDTENRGDISLDHIKAKRLVDSFGKLKALVVAKNLGANALAVKGTVTLHQWDGKQIKRWFIYPDVILAGSTRGARTIDLDPQELTPEETVIFSEIEYKNFFLIGPYTLTVQLEDPTGNTEYITTSLIALPFSLFVLAFLGVGLTLGIIVWQRRQQPR